MTLFVSSYLGTIPPHTYTDYSRVLVLNVKLMCLFYMYFCNLKLYIRYFNEFQYRLQLTCQYDHPQLNK